MTESPDWSIVLSVKELCRGEVALDTAIATSYDGRDSNVTPAASAAGLTFGKQRKTMSETRHGTSSKETIGAALGRIPSGLFVVTAKLDDRSTGMLASWVQQVGFEPPTISLAVRKGRLLTSWLERHPYFALNQIGQGQKHLLKHFGAGFEPDANAFEGISVTESETHGTIVIDDAVSWMECQLAHVFATGTDHDLIVARVISGQLSDGAVEPAVHLRKSGLHY